MVTMSHHEIADTLADKPMTRAEYGSGSLYQRTSDWRWMAAFKAGFTDSGQRKRVTVSGPGCVGGCKPRCHHVAAMKRKVRDKRVELDANGRVSTKRTTSVARWSQTWLEDIQTSVRPSAYETDKAAVKVIVAAIGEIKLADLTPVDVKEVAKYLRRKGKSTSTALRYHGTLTRMLKAAALAGYLIQPNVLLGKKPKAAVHDRQAIPLPDALKLLECVAAKPDASRWALAFLQGLRQAEALGLTWDQVDLERGTLTISWQVKALRYREAGNPDAGFLMPDGYEAQHLVGSTHLVRPKSAAGWRVQPLVPWAEATLRRWREAAPPNPHGLVWPGRTQKGRTWPRNPASDRERWAEIQAEVGVSHPSGRPFTVHEIRNTTATLLMELQVPESVRIAIMGHSNIATTRGYEFVDLEQSRKALEQAAQRLGLT
jgi:integrase